MSQLPSLRGREVQRALERAGFLLIRQKGSHRIYFKNKIGITIPYHNKDLKPKTLKHIIKRSGLEIEEFIKLL